MAAQTVLMDFILHENFDFNCCEQKVKDMLEEQLAKGGTVSNILKVEMRQISPTLIGAKFLKIWGMWFSWLNFEF